MTSLSKHLLITEHQNTRVDCICTRRLSLWTLMLRHTAALHDQLAAFVRLSNEFLDSFLQHFVPGWQHAQQKCASLKSPLFRPPTLTISISTSYSSCGLDGPYGKRHTSPNAAVSDKFSQNYTVRRQTRLQLQIRCVRQQLARDEIAVLASKSACHGPSKALQISQEM